MKDLELLSAFHECDVYYNPDLKAVQTKWKGPSAQGDALYSILNAIIDAMKDKKTGIVIADARQMQVISREDQKWISDNWYPRALAAGFSHEALVVTQYTFNEVSVKKIVRTYDEQKLKTGYFKSLPSAYDWVMNGFN